MGYRKDTGYNEAQKKAFKEFFQEYIEVLNTSGIERRLKMTNRKFRVMYNPIARQKGIVYPTVKSSEIDGLFKLIDEMKAQVDYIRTAENFEVCEGDSVDELGQPIV